MTTQQLTQPLQALKRGNEVRIERARIKRAVAAGELSVADLILESPEILRVGGYSQPITLTHLLSWQSYWSEARAERFLNGLEITPTLTPFALSESRRRYLAEALDA